MRRFTVHRAVMPLFAAILAAAGLPVAVAAPANASPPGRQFTPVFSANTTGDIMLRGNTLLTCPAGSTGSNPNGISCALAQGSGSTGADNNFTMAYVDVDADVSTFNSSSATVTVPAGAKVLYAGLSWAANTTAGVRGAAALTPDDKGIVSFKAPGGSYSSLTSTQTDVNATSDYQAYVDVTATVADAGSGVYTIGNVQAGTGRDRYAGWSLAIAYQDPTLPMRNLVVYTGYRSVTATAPTLTVPISGFLTPSTGPVVTRVGFVTYEGDRGTSGDKLTVGTTNMFNALNPVNDVFNSTSSDLGVATTGGNPSFGNLLGIDIDRFDATGALANGATSTTIGFKTAASTGESYFPGLLTFATNLFSPSLTATKSVSAVNEGPASPGDLLNYSIAVTNTGSDASLASVLTDAVPAGTTYVAGSLTVGGVGVTDAAGDDPGNVTAGTVTARLGTGATDSAGGRMAVSASSTVAFQVQVNAVADGTVISNGAGLAYTAETSGAELTGVSNTVTTAVVVPPTLTFTPPPSGDIGAAYSDQLTKTGGTGPYVWSVSAGSLPDGLSLDAATGLLSGTPTALGASNFTVTVTDVNSRADSQATSIVIVGGPTLTFSPPSDGQLNLAFSDQLTKSGGTAPFAWSVSAGSLPAGILLDDSTGLLSGTPTAIGTSNFTVTVTDTYGLSDDEPVAFVVGKAVSAVVLTTPLATVGLTDTITLTATVSPATPTGTVEFHDVAATGNNAGVEVSIGTGTISGGVATLTRSLQTFGLHTYTAIYSGDAGHTSGTSAAITVEVAAARGMIIVQEFRLSGPGGVNDQYVQLTNPTSLRIPLAGFKVTGTDGSLTLALDTPKLAAGTSYLIAGSDFSLGAYATPDLINPDELGVGGLSVTAPDTASTVTDAVGSSVGFSSGTALPVPDGPTSAVQYAWARQIALNAVQDTHDNRADFNLVSVTGGVIQGAQSVLGSPAPAGSEDPQRVVTGVPTTLLDPAFTALQFPNRTIVASPGKLVSRRTITNNTGRKMTKAYLRITAISQSNGRPAPGALTQPVNKVNLVVVTPTPATSSISITGVPQPVTVRNLALTSAQGNIGGGLNSTLNMPLPVGGLPNGQSVSFSITFTAGGSGSFWFTYDTDVIARSEP